MSRVDTTFGTLAQRLVSSWTMSDVVFVRNGVPSYDTVTGEIAQTETRIPLDAVITKLMPKEYEGLYQKNDVKIIPDPTLIGDEPITESDWFEYPENGRTIRAKVVDARQYRGDSPVAFICIARPQ
jgi:hypothetical protein